MRLQVTHLLVQLWLTLNLLHSLIKLAKLYSCGATLPAPPLPLGRLRVQEDWIWETLLNIANNFIYIEEVEHNVSS